MDSVGHIMYRAAAFVYYLLSGSQAHFPFLYNVSFPVLLASPRTISSTYELFTLNPTKSIH